VRSPAEAVAIALSACGLGTYRLGAGDHDTPLDGEHDCRFAVLRTFDIKAHRPGFNDGEWATVSDDVNYNSLIEDGDHRRELAERIYRPELGAILCYPTIRLPGRPKPFIGHGAIVVGLDRVLEWDPVWPDWSMIDVVQCRGPNGRHPAISRTDATHWNSHDSAWPKPAHRSALLRIRQH
jgi:hypothetical protein